MITLRGRKVFLTGRLTGDPEWNGGAFAHAASALRSVGAEVYSIREGLDPRRPITEEDVARDLDAFDAADVVVFLPGAEGAIGVTLAGAYGIPVVPFETLKAA